MALGQEAEPELRVIRGRGRPRKEYPKHPLAPKDEARLSAHLRESILWDGYPLRPLTAPWYMPAADERLGDSLTLAWLKEYRELYPDDWTRMLRTLRKSGGSKTWGQARARKKNYRDVPELANGDSILGDGDDPVYLQDLAHVMTLYPGMNRAHKNKRQPIHRYQTFSAGAFVDPDEPAEINLVVVQKAIYVAFAPIREGTTEDKGVLFVGSGSKT
jgi:hypothetical protein